MVSEKKSFPLDVVVSFTSGFVPFCDPYLIDKMLDFITGEDSLLLAHKLPDAYKFAKPLVRAEHPELEIAEGPEAAQTSIELIRAMGQRHGNDAFLELLRENGLKD